MLTRNETHDAACGLAGSRGGPGWCQIGEVPLAERPAGNREGECAVQARASRCHLSQLIQNDLFVRDEEVLPVAMTAEIAESEPKSGVFRAPESLYLRCEEFPQELFAAVLLGRVGQRGAKSCRFVPFAAACRRAFSQQVHRPGGPLREPGRAPDNQGRAWLPKCD